MPFGFMQGLTISSVQAADQHVVVGLLIAQMREHRIEPQRDSLSQIVTSALRDEQYGFLLLARLGSQIIGVAYVATILSVEHGGRVGWLEELYVLPEHREHGVGTALLSAVLERAQGLGLVAVDLEVDVEHQRAESLYGRFGFRKLPRSRWVKELDPG